MKKLVAAAVIGLFALTCAPVFAAEVTRTDEVRVDPDAKRTAKRAKKKVKRAAKRTKANTQAAASRAGDRTEAAVDRARR